MHAEKINARRGRTPSAQAKTKAISPVFDAPQAVELLTGRAPRPDAYQSAVARKARVKAEAKRALTRPSTAARTDVADV